MNVHGYILTNLYLHKQGLARFDLQVCRPLSLVLSRPNVAESLHLLSDWPHSLVSCQQCGWVPVSPCFLPAGLSCPHSLTVTFFHCEAWVVDICWRRPCPVKFKLCTWDIITIIYYVPGAVLSIQVIAPSVSHWPCKVGTSGICFFRWGL